MTWTAETSLGNEAGKIKWDLVEYTNGVGLDLGCGHSKAFPHFIGVDNGHHWGTAGADIAVKTCEDLSIFAGQSMDFVFSSHLLEHIQDTKVALKEWWRVLKVGGRLCLYLPHKDLYPNCGQPGSNPDHKHDFMPDDIEGIMKELGGWDMVRNETRAETNEYSFFQVYRKLASDKHRYSYREPKPAKTACVV
ncbi:class I SAM-dependent methyltransferase, partial [bacterium]|nr:class I SAM-dependent methyltransferase [bacterium]